MVGWRHTVVQTPPVLTPTPGMYNGLFPGVGGVTQTRSGFVKLTVTAKTTFSGSLQIGSRRYAVSGPFETHATGCGFSGTVYDTKVLPITDGELIVSEGTLPGSLSAFFKLLARNKVAQTGGPRMSISFSCSTGLMTGRVLEPFSLKWLSFKGVVLQRAKQASGYFLKDGQSGKVTAQQFGEF